MAKVDREDPIQGRIVHEYDGIEEADNRLPMWWLWTLWGAIVFAMGYWYYYHELDIGPTQREVYMAERAEREAEQAELAKKAESNTPSPEALAALADDPSAVEDGEQRFASLCASCHKADGSGNIGPNLTDSHWLHGGGPVDILSTIRDGVPDKGMPGWAAALGPEGLKNVTAFVLAQRGKDLPGKEPEGEPYSPDGPKTGEAPSERGATAAKAL